jgi:hypothetical protein
MNDAPRVLVPARSRGQDAAARLTSLPARQTWRGAQPPVSGVRTIPFFRPQTRHAEIYAAV